MRGLGYRAQVPWSWSFDLVRFEVVYNLRLSMFTLSMVYITVLRFRIFSTALNPDFDWTKGVRIWVGKEQTLFTFNIFLLYIIHMYIKGSYSTNDNDINTYFLWTSSVLSDIFPTPKTLVSPFPSFPYFS